LVNIVFVELSHNIIEEQWRSQGVAGLELAQRKRGKTCFQYTCTVC